MSIPLKPSINDSQDIFIEYNNYNCSYINAKLETTNVITSLLDNSINGIRPFIDIGSINSRDTGVNVDFFKTYDTGLVTNDNQKIDRILTYDVRKERRKAEVLQHNNNNNHNIINNQTKKEKFSYFMKYGKSKFPGTSESCNSKYKGQPGITSSSGIYGGRDIIYLDPKINVQFFL